MPNLKLINSWILDEQVGLKTQIFKLFLTFLRLFKSQLMAKSRIRSKLKCLIKFIQKSIQKRSMWDGGTKKF